MPEFAIGWTCLRHPSVQIYGCGIAAPHQVSFTKCFFCCSCLYNITTAPVMSSRRLKSSCSRASGSVRAWRSNEASLKRSWQAGAPSWVSALTFQTLSLWKHQKHLAATRHSPGLICYLKLQSMFCTSKNNNLPCLTLSLHVACTVQCSLQAVSMPSLQPGWSYLQGQGQGELQCLNAPPHTTVTDAEPCLKLGLAASVTMPWGGCCILQVRALQPALNLIHMINQGRKLGKCCC